MFILNIKIIITIKIVIITITLILHNLVLQVIILDHNTKLWLFFKYVQILKSITS